MLERLKEIIKELSVDGNLDIERIELNDTITQHWDSLMQVELVNELEKEYGIRFTMKQIVEMKTIKDIIEAINECIKNK